MNARVKTTLKNLGFNPAQHMRVADAVKYFGFNCYSGFRKALLNDEWTPSAPKKYGTDRMGYYRKDDVIAMVTLYPYWNMRREIALGADSTKIHRVRPQMLEQHSLPLTINEMPSLKIKPVKQKDVVATDKEVPVKVEMSADVQVVEKRLAGYQMAVTRFGITKEEARELAKAGLFD